MNSIAVQFAAAAPAKQDLFSALGIDWKTLLIQIAAFLILVGLLGKFVYPWLMKSVDSRQEAIEAAAKAAQIAQESADDTEKKIQKLLKDARNEANDILATAKLEATSALTDAENKARNRTEQIIKDAHAEIDKDILAAKKALKDETLTLVSLATETVLGKTISKDIDQKIIAETVKQVR